MRLYDAIKSTSITIFQREIKMSSPPSCPHFVIFPFMAQGHIIPLIYFSRLLQRRSVAVTVVTTPGNSPFIRDSLREVSIIELDFPKNIQGVPPGVENTDKLSMESSFLPFARATEQMQESFEKSLETLDPPVSCIVADILLWWTKRSADKLGVPRLDFFGMGNFSSTMYEILLRFRPDEGIDSADEPFSMTHHFLDVKLTRNHFNPPYNEKNPSGPFMEFMEEIDREKGSGLIVNSFYELESRYVDFFNENFGPKAWNVGPLCLAAPSSEDQNPKETNILDQNHTFPPAYLKWLDDKLDKGDPVLYVAFGTHSELPKEQYLEIAAGLEKSEVSFLWALKSKGLDFLPEFESRVKDRGFVAKEFVAQPKILQHKGVKGFLTHCGWNSVTECISVGVPILALPLWGEQHLNARFLTEEIEVGLRIVPRGGSARGDVAAEEVERKVRELMRGGDAAEEVRKKAAEWRRAAHDATREGGSSWCSLNLLIESVVAKKL